MTKRELKLTSTGTSPSVEFKIGSKVAVILEINAGFLDELFGGIKCALIAKRSTEDWDSYFASGVTVPSPGGNHASIFSWHGCKFWFGSDYTFKVVGKPQSSTTMYVDLVIDDDIKKYMSMGGHSIGGAHFAWMAPGGKVVTNYATLGAVDDHSFTVPADRRWITMGKGYIERDQNATLVFTLHDENDNQLVALDSIAAGTSDIDIPLTSSSNVARANLFKDIIMPEDWYIKVAWGATQTSPVVSFLVLEVPG